MVTTTERGDHRLTAVEGMVRTDGAGESSLPFSTVDDTLRAQCGLMFHDQRTEDARRADPEGLKRPARMVLAGFMDEFPNSGPRFPSKETARLGGAMCERDIRHLVEPDPDGEVVAIDVDWGEWAAARDEAGALYGRRESRPGAVNILHKRIEGT